MSEAKKTAPRRRTSNELNALIDWVSTIDIGVPITVKVNGHLHPTALVVVDLGQPVKPVRLTNDQVSELHSRLRRVGKEIMNRDVQIRATPDHQAGIHWASVA